MDDGTSEEEWRAVAAYQGLYEVSSLARVRSFQRNYPSPRIMRQQVNSRTGWLVVGLCGKEGRPSRKNEWVHELVAEAFLDERPAGHGVRFKDGDCLNAVAANLEWAMSAARVLAAGAYLCQVCGGGLRSHNTLGVCGRTPECIRRRDEMRRERIRAEGRPKPKCGHPGGCPNLVRKGRYCAIHAERLELTGDLGPVETRKVIIQAGDAFGRWTALEDHDSSTRTTLVRCECGGDKSERRVASSSLLRGVSKSCGCWHDEWLALPRIDGLHVRAGDVFGRLTVLEDAAFCRDLVRCRCACGNNDEVITRAEYLKGGGTRSCGCLQADTMRQHGLSTHPLYSIWKGMVDRCTDPANAAYEDYGGRGIAVCERWLGIPDGFLNFAEDLGTRPPGLSIDRYPDNDGDYEPGNVRWATAKQQNANKRSVRKLTRERDEARRERDEAIAERDVLAAEVERLTRLLAA